MRLQKFGAYFQKNFSNTIYKQDFIMNIPTENIPLNSIINPNSREQRDLNSNITIKEMEDVLKN